MAGGQPPTGGGVLPPVAPTGAGMLPAQPTLSDLVAQAAPVQNPLGAMNAADPELRRVAAMGGPQGMPTTTPSSSPMTTTTPTPGAPLTLSGMQQPGGQPAAPKAEMPPEIASAPRAIQDRWRLQQTKQSIAGAGTFTPQALEFVANQYLRGDRQAVQGFARSATARIALQNAIVDEAAKQGLSPEATAAKMAEFSGTVAGARTVGQRAANISLAATEAKEMLDIVKETSDKFGRTKFVPFNMALKAFESGTGEPEIAEFGAAVNALVNVYARAINPTGVPTVSDKEHARAVLNVVQSPEQVDAVLGIIRRELSIAQKAPDQVRDATRRGIIGGPVPTEAVTAPSGAASQPIRNMSKSGKKIISKDGGKTWEYE